MTQKKFLIEFITYVEKELNPDGYFSPIPQLANKALEIALRASATLAFYEDQNLDDITIENMARGVTLAKYWLEEALRVRYGSYVDETAKNAQLLLDWAKEKRHSIVYSQLIQRYGPNKLRKNTLISEAMNRLVDHLYAIPMENELVEGRRRKLAWRLINV